MGNDNREILFVVEESPESGFTARSMGPSIITEADDLAELKHKVIDAVRCHFDDSVPRMIRLHMVKDEVFGA